MRAHATLGILAVALSVGCRGQPAEDLTPGRAVETMQLTSTAFADGQTIPKKYTADGEDVSPPLRWSGAPEGTRSLALICDDPDAPRGTWVHWVLYGLSPDTRELTEGVPPDPDLAAGARQGVNDFRRTGYGGPSPPPGKPHRYFFKLYALDSVPDLKAGATKAQLVGAMKGHVVGEGQLVGTYGR